MKVISEVSFTYRNHRGEEALRTVRDISIEFIIHPGYGYQSGWFLRGYDTDKKAVCSFRLSNIVLPNNSSDYRIKL